MSQRIADASAKVARSFYLLPRMTDNVLFGLSRTMAGLSGEVVQHLNVLKSFSSYSGRQHAEQPLAAVHEAGYGTSRRSQPNINLVAIGGEADMPRPPAPYQSDAIDPNRSLAGLKSRTAARAPATSRCAILSCEARRHWAVRRREFKRAPPPLDRPPDLLPAALNVGGRPEHRNGCADAAEHAVAPAGQQLDDAQGNERDSTLARPSSFEVILENLDHLSHCAR
jgi:hypothetical protein